MKLADHLTCNLRSILTAVLFREHNRSQLNHLINVSHTLAFVFIRSKVTEATREARFQGLSYSDIAFDCIADLFQQDNDGELPT